jgi:hypothetical protein
MTRPPLSTLRLSQDTIPLEMQPRKRKKLLPFPASSKAKPNLANRTDRENPRPTLILLPMWKEKNKPTTIKLRFTGIPEK